MKVMARNLTVDLWLRHESCGGYSSASRRCEQRTRILATVITSRQCFALRLSYPLTEQVINDPGHLIKWRPYHLVEPLAKILKLLSKYRHFLHSRQTLGRPSIINTIGRIRRVTFIRTRTAASMVTHYLGCGICKNKKLGREPMRGIAHVASSVG